MTKHILHQLLLQPFIQERYYVSDVDGHTFNGWYGAILLIDVHFNVLNLNLIDFPQSAMGRRLISADIKLIDNNILRIGTVHLESLDNARQRSSQLDICHRTFNRLPGTYILMGDFNFDAYGQENIDQFNRLPQWHDVWTLLKEAKNYGFTFDTEKNAMTRYHDRTSIRSRCDRIILSSQTIVPRDIEILGNEPIGTHGSLPIFPSDHFGLTACFKIKNDK